ncbi:hypothetical protein CROQUDRAFT_656195, partial [Cronartium quercuum f. sp. fusiforme G11]
EFSLNELIKFIRLKWSKVQSRVCGLRSCVGCGCCVWVWVWVVRGSLEDHYTMGVYLGEWT